jgi:uncharacterized membrane protein
LIVAALSVIHSLRTRGLRRTLLFAALGNAIPILGELLTVRVLKMLRHHVRPQVKGVPLAIALGWYNVGYGTLAIVKGIAPTVWTWAYGSGAKMACTPLRLRGRMASVASRC